MTGTFAHATAVTRRVSDRQLPGSTTDTKTGSMPGTATFDAEVEPGWDIGGIANGGYLMALAGRAMADAIGRPPLTLTAHYLNPAPPGPCEIEVTTVRTGRRLATAVASMRRGEAEIIRLLGTFGEQTPGGPEMTMELPVGLPSYEACVAPPPVRAGDGPDVAIMDRLAIRMRPGDEGFRAGRPTGRAEMVGWFAFADESPIDAIALLLAADAFPPSVFNSGLPAAWVPTVELTVHVRGVPAPGPVRCRFRSRFVRDGMLDEDGEFWDSSGTLVAQSRQLALLPRPT